MTRRFKFGDIVREIKEKIDQSDNPYKYFVAGDHMDSEDIHLRRKGEFANSDVGPAFIRVFKPGQVLYGSRRTYLKKVAVADFEGITANTTFVLETKDENIFCQKLLPFLLLSDRFTDFSISKSKGSTNPYVLFSDLKGFEVDLPDLVTQERIAQILLAIDDVIQNYTNLLIQLDELVKSRFVEMFGNPIYNTNNLPLKNLNELGTWNSGGTPSRTKPAYFTGDIDWYSAGELNTLYLNGSIEKITEAAIEESAAKLFKAGSMLVGMYDTAAFKMGILKVDSASNQACACIEPNDSVNIVWLYYSLQLMKKHFLLQRRGVRQKNLNLGMIKGFEIPVADRGSQDEFVSFVKQVDKSKFTIENALSDLKEFCRSYTKQVFDIKD